MRYRCLTLETESPEVYLDAHTYGNFGKSIHPAEGDPLGPRGYLDAKIVAEAERIDPELPLGSFNDLP